MMKRVTWFVAGAATGAAGAIAGARKVRRATERLAPSNVARTAVEGVRGRARDVVDAVREGRAAMVAKEQQLRALRDGHPVSYGLVADGSGGVIDADAFEARAVGAAGHHHHGVHDLALWRQRPDRRRRR